MNTPTSPDSILRALKDYTRWVVAWLFFFYLITLILTQTPIGRDDSDPGNWGDRSYLKPRTDNLTGCQYLETSSGGGITPRLDGNGKHVGCK